MIEAGQYKQALGHLTQYASQTLDKLWVQETKGRSNLHFSVPTRVTSDVDMLGAALVMPLVFNVDVV